jgi:hypothetical protein
LLQIQPSISTTHWPGLSLLFRDQIHISTSTAAHVILSYLTAGLLRQNGDSRCRCLSPSQLHLPIAGLGLEQLDFTPVSGQTFHLASAHHSPWDQWHECTKPASLPTVIYHRPPIIHKVSAALACKISVYSWVAILCHKLGIQSMCFVRNIVKDWRACRPLSPPLRILQNPSKSTFPPSPVSLTTFAYVLIWVQVVGSSR